MAILDIISLTLADFQSSLDNPPTALSCLWQDVITTISETRGIVKLAWGRKPAKPAEVVIFSVWQDKTCRDAFHLTGMGTTAMNHYLQGPVQTRFALDVQHYDMFVHGATAFLSTNNRLEASPDGGINEGFVVATGHQILSVAEMYRLDVLEDGRLRHVLEPGQLMVLSAEESTNPPVGLVHPPWRQEIIRKGEQISVRGFYPRTNYGSTGVPRPVQMCHLFTRDKAYYGAQLPEDNEGLYTTVDSPMGSAEPPENSYRCPKDHQFFPFSGTASSLAIPPQPASPWETLIFTFKETAPQHSDTTSEAGKRWYAYRKAIACTERPGCLQSFVATYPTVPQLGYLCMQFESLNHADPIYSTQAASAAFAALQPYLQKSPAREVGIPFFPFGETHDPHYIGQKGEIVDFILPGNATDIDRRALELYIAKFLYTLQTPFYTNDQIQPLPQGWVDPSRLNLQQTTLSYQAGTTQRVPSNKFRIVFQYRQTLHVEMWARRFIESRYEEEGHRAHWLALLCEQVQGTRVVVKRDSRGEFEMREKWEEVSRVR